MISHDITEYPSQNARQQKRVRRRHTVGGTKDFGAVLSIAENKNIGSGSNGSKIDDEEKENEKALRRMSLPVEVADDEGELFHGSVALPKSQNPKVLVSQV